MRSPWAPPAEVPSAAAPQDCRGADVVVTPEEKRLARRKCGSRKRPKQRLKDETINNKEETAKTKERKKKDPTHKDKAPKPLGTSLRTSCFILVP